jgi:hypothetical protein
MAATTTPLPRRGSIHDLERYARRRIERDGGVILPARHLSQHRQLDKLARRLDDDGSLHIRLLDRDGWRYLIVLPLGVWMSRRTIEASRGNY